LNDAADRLEVADCRRIHSPYAVARMNVGYREDGQTAVDPNQQVDLCGSSRSRVGSTISGTAAFRAARPAPGAAMKPH
jgi:hypothetical protein